MNDWQNTVIITIIGLIGAGVGGVVGSAWQRRRASDRQIFLLMRQTFDRPAFRGPYMYHSEHEVFAKAIAMCLKTVETGKYFDRSGKEISKLEGLYRGPFYLQNEGRRKTLEEVSNRLQRIVYLSKQMAEDLTTCEDIKKKIDDERDAIISSLNLVWRNMNIAEMPLPTEIRIYEQVLDPQA